jgi:hypothetical protein
MRKFGLMLDPEKFEGGGCGSFGAAIVRHAQLLPDDLIAKLRRTLSAPSSLFGWGQKLPEDTAPFRPGAAAESRRPRHVGLLTLLDHSWDLPGPRESLSLVDPELFIFALRTLHLLHLESPQGRLKTTRDSYYARYPRERVVTSIHSLVNERRSTPILAADPLWSTERYAIDANFDDQTQAIDQQLRAWWKHKLSSGYRSEMIFDERLAYVVIRRTE